MTTKKPWTFDDIPDQTGRTAVVTGANTGIGLETARMLARRGAHVVLACRNVEKGEAAVRRIAEEKPSGTATLAALDLSDLDSVAGFARELLASHERLDLLVNNAGVMIPPLSYTRQGFELQLGTNHFGHFALTGLLMPLVLATPGSRVVTVASTAQSAGRIDFDDLDWRRRSYSAFRAYGQSKLANMMFALELHRRLVRAGRCDASGREGTRSTAAHPGWTATDLQRTAGVIRHLNPLLAMKPVDGALPTLRAATDDDAISGTYWGPSRLFELTGPPALARIPKHARDADVARRLWEASERLTGITFNLAAPISKAS